MGDPYNNIHSTFTVVRKQRTTSNKMTISRIFLIEEDADDREIFEIAIGSINAAIQVTALPEQDELISRIKQSSPDLILINLKFPKNDNGFKILEQIMMDDELRNIPAAMYTSWMNPDEILFSFDHGARFYIEKPGTYAGLVENLNAAFHLHSRESKDIAPVLIRRGKSYEVNSLSDI